MPAVDLLGNKYHLLLELHEYSTNNDRPNHGVTNMWFTVAAFFAAMWVIEWTAKAFWSSIDSKFIKSEHAKTIMGRHTNDFLAMAAISFTGWQGLMSFGGWGAYASLIKDGQELAIGAERVYQFSAACQRLCVLQLAYEAKNFCDSIIHNDGPIFLAHHFLAGFAALAASTPFMHVYAAFYLGYSEISTMVLCVIVLFDKDRGLPGLADAYPLVMQVTGVLFAVLFTLYRIVLWPWVSYYFWIDMMHLMEHNTWHSAGHCYFVMFINVSLTSVQFLWFKEILDQAWSLLKTGKPLAIDRGDGKAKSSSPRTPAHLREVPTPTRRQPSRSAKKD